VVSVPDPPPLVLLELHLLRVSGDRYRRAAGPDEAIALRLVSGAAAWRDRAGVFPSLEVRIHAPGSIYFTSGTTDPVTAVETTLLLPVLFSAWRRSSPRWRSGWRRDEALPPLRAYTINLAGSLAGVAAFAPSRGSKRRQHLVHRRLRAAAPLLRNRRWTAAALAAVLVPRRLRRARLRHAGEPVSPYYKIVKQIGRETVVE